jgi:hypothetical protein
MQRQEGPAMLDTKTRLLEAELALHRLELQVEQYRLHLDGLVAQPHEIERARQALEKATKELAHQRTYCYLLAAEVDGLPAKRRSLRVA